MKTILLASLLSLSALTYAQNIGINGSGTNAHPSALLDIDASTTPSLGILIPRIALEATNLTSPISSPATSLLVYNTATVISGPTSVVPGYYYWDGTKWVRFQYTSNITQDWGLTGNSGTTAGTNFIGTTDNQDLVFKRNNVLAGLLNYSLNSTSFGIEALNPNNTGVNNTSVGYKSLQRNTSGNYNTATGAYGLQNNLSGNSNTAHGFYALWLNTTGDQNTAIGFATLANNTSGVSNTAIGFESLNGNTGNDNTGVGLTSLYLNSTGNRNNAIGLSALYSNTTANDNTAVGYSSMFNNTTGFGNVSVGNVSGTNNITGSKNTFIGYGANATTGALTNATAIGNNAQVGQSNALILGGTGGNAVNVGIGTTTPSEKLEIQGTVKIVDGTQGVGKVLVSDAAGKASWQSIGDVVTASSLTTAFPLTSNVTWLYTGSSINIPPGLWELTSTCNAFSPTAFNNGYLYTSFSTTQPAYTQATWQVIVNVDPTHQNSPNNINTSLYNNSTSGVVTLYYFVYLGTNLPFDPNALINTGAYAAYAKRIK